MLRLKRKKICLKQNEASAMLGIHKSYLSLIENRKRINLDPALMRNICIVYQVSVVELLSFLQGK